MVYFGRGASHGWLFLGRGEGQAGLDPIVLFTGGEGNLRPSSFLSPLAAVYFDFCWALFTIRLVVDRFPAPIVFPRYFLWCSAINFDIWVFNLPEFASLRTPDFA
ncbi:uncharacterized protein BP01DRAFT_80639 [Aspergillus saccharolyticus JOP 1030-1]|uniref:Uncharacterized protein n=1 Tax=Aspergillus saccharolyticus JOP 1030-1 TaxID=1450539 RepID=A0A318ZAN5_9EURO|nr:hypothetical protein BP01DRAFT_80639 [Aspergillus saccharolyticus JOP 1030-1]PYH44349.1 hypothetical protein BP01DRAFT_80639 [Aspergillus saccharolyticus JOP 1030-1]